MMATKTKAYVNQQRVKKRLFYPVCKRGFDLIASLLALVLLSPLFLVIALRIKTEDGTVSIILCTFENPSLYEMLT